MASAETEQVALMKDTDDKKPVTDVDASMGQALMKDTDDKKPVTDVDASMGQESRRGSVSSVALSIYDAALDRELDEELTGQTCITLHTLGGGKYWGTESDLDENAYGAAAVGIVKDVTKLARQSKEGAPWTAISLTVIRLSFGFGIMVSNLAFQLIILMYIYDFVVQPSVRTVQTLYSEFHSQAFDEDGDFLMHVWEDYEHKTEVCQITMSSPAFYFGILILWGLLMMIELRNCQRVMDDVLKVKHVDSLNLMLDYVSTDNYELGGRCLIIGLTEPMRWAVVLSVCLPRFLIGLMLLFLGCQWLSSADSFADMTLNAVALDFVKNIDEILYLALVPKALTRSIADTSLFIIQQRKTKKDLENDEWKGYVKTAFWIVFMTVFLSAFGMEWQTVLPFDLTELTRLCQAQVKESQTPLCVQHTWFGKSEECFPYGGFDSSPGPTRRLDEAMDTQEPVDK